MSYVIIVPVHRVNTIDSLSELFKISHRDAKNLEGVYLARFTMALKRNYMRFKKTLNSVKVKVLGKVDIALKKRIRALKKDLRDNKKLYRLKKRYNSFIDKADERFFRENYIDGLTRLIRKYNKDYFKQLKSIENG